MKPYLSLLTVLCATLVPASAIQLKDIVGYWSGRHTETKNGAGHVFDVTLTGKKQSDGSYRLVEEVYDYGIVSTHTFRKDGKFTSRTEDGSTIYSTYTGTWRVKSDRIIITAKGTDGKLSGFVAGTKSKIQFSGITKHLKVSVSARRE